MKIRAILLPAFLSCLMAAPRGLAQREPPKSETARFGNPTATARVFQGYIYGVIKKINTTEVVLNKTEFGDDQTFKLDSKTKYIHDGKPSSLAKLKAGDQVYIDVKKEKKTGDMVAKKVVTGIAPTQAP